MPQRDRAQTEILGYALVFAIALTLAVLIVMYGGTVIVDGQAAAGEGQAADTLTLFAARADLVARGESHVEAIDVPDPGSGQYVVRENASHLRLTHNFTPAGPDNETIYSRNVGALRYESDRETVAYAVGGVWRQADEQRGNGSVMVEPPRVVHRNDTLTLPIVRLPGERAAAGGKTIVATRNATLDRPIYPNATAAYDDRPNQYRNPIETGEIRLSVTGPFYDAWGAYFRDQFDGRVDVDDDERRATVVLREADDEIAFLHASERTLDVRFD